MNNVGIEEHAKNLYLELPPIKTEFSDESTFQLSSKNFCF